MLIFRPRGQSHRLEHSKPWTHLIKLPGLRGTSSVEVSCHAEHHRHSLITPRRVRVKADINVITGEISLVEPEQRIRWSHIPDSIARSTSHVAFEHILVIPDENPAARKVTSSEFKASVDRVTTMRDRAIIKGTASMVIHYVDS